MKRFYILSLLAINFSPTNSTPNSDQWVKNNVSHIHQGSPSTHLESLKNKWEKDRPQGVTLESMTASFWNRLDPPNPIR